MCALSHSSSVRRARHETARFSVENHFSVETATSLDCPIAGDWFSILTAKLAPHDYLYTQGIY